MATLSPGVFTYSDRYLNIIHRLNIDFDTAGLNGDLILIGDVIIYYKLFLRLL